ncbi:DNA-directed RNA polymerase subunit L [Candidatus Bathyarchaeota archaeon]|nr:DNA-directed RNA polymerase subunit L [Candidatus Bathyarchaeota archaeon]
MKVNVLKRNGNELKIEVEGAGHTLCNLLQKRLLEDENVELAGYDVPHPLASNPIIYVRTKGRVKPEEAFLTAIEKSREMNKAFIKELKKALKM